MSGSPIQIPVGGTVAAAGVPGNMSPNARSVKLKLINMEDTFSTFHFFLPLNSLKMTCFTTIRERRPNVSIFQVFLIYG